MTDVEKWCAARLDALTAQRQGQTVYVGKRLHAAHASYHRKLHTPRYPQSSLWHQLAFLNYTAFVSAAGAALLLDKLAGLNSEIASAGSAPMERERLFRALLVDALLAKLGTALDATAAGIVGLLGSQQPLDKPVHFFQLTKPSAVAAAATEGAWYKATLAAAHQRLRDLQLYRNKTVHTATLLRHIDQQDRMHLLNLRGIYPAPPPKDFDPAAFLRVYGTENPIYGGIQNPRDYHALPLAEQLHEYIADGVQTLAELEERMAQTYSSVTKPLL